LRILLTGKNGQVGSALQRTLPELGEVIALDRSQLDLAQPASVRDAVRAAQPDVIVNAAAYTAVDQAEREVSQSFAANRDGPAVLADEAATRGALLIHFSTDYVFDGEKSSPYVETDASNPLNTYGRSKLAGEEAIRHSGCVHLILRTSWVYSKMGKNFLLTMLQLARQRGELRVVDDQHGAPTSSAAVARASTEALARLAVDRSLGGTYHMTAEGSTTWFGFAREIFQQKRMSVSVVAIRSEDFKTAARRPRNSVLDNGKLAAKFGIRVPTWTAGLREVLAGMDRVMTPKGDGA
jgi:dTDP-4-dehydrorhamnose reductase